MTMWTRIRFILYTDTLTVFLVSASIPNSSIDIKKMNFTFQKSGKLVQI